MSTGTHTTMTTTPEQLHLFRGDLSLQVGRGGVLYLVLTIRCPGCSRQPHVHTWPGTVDDAPQPRAAHCFRRASPYYGGTYLIVPRPTGANRRAVDLLAELERHPRRRRHFVRQLRIAQRSEVTPAERTDEYEW